MLQNKVFVRINTQLKNFLHGSYFNYLQGGGQMDIVGIKKTAILQKGNTSI